MNNKKEINVPATCWLYIRKCVGSRRQPRNPIGRAPRQSAANCMARWFRALIYPRSGHDGVPNTTNSADVVQRIGSGDKKEGRLASEFCEQEGRLQVRRQWHWLSPKVAWTYHKNWKKTSHTIEWHQQTMKMPKRKQSSSNDGGKANIPMVGIWSSIEKQCVTQPLPNTWKQKISRLKDLMS